MEKPILEVQILAMLYDERCMEITKERLADLRKEKKLSFEQLSRELEKRGVIISHTNLMYYEIGDSCHKLYDRTRSMSIEILAGLADFYSVSLDYLMGFTTARNPDYQVIADTLLLSDETIENILCLRDYDEECIKGVHGRVMAVLNIMFRDKRVIQAIHDMATSEIAYRNSFISCKDDFKEECENNEELQEAIRKISKAYMIAVGGENVTDFFVNRAIVLISEFIRDYPEVGYTAAMKRMAKPGEI